MITKAVLQQIANFDARFPVGTPVHYWPGARVGTPLVSRTRSNAYAIGGRAVVQVEGRSGCIALSHVEPCRWVESDLCSACAPEDAP
jgi:hypothetical protein